MSVKKREIRNVDMIQNDVDMIQNDVDKISSMEFRGGF